MRRDGERVRGQRRRAPGSVLAAAAMAVAVGVPTAAHAADHDRDDAPTASRQVAATPATPAPSPTNRARPAPLRKPRRAPAASASRPEKTAPARQRARHRDSHRDSGARRARVTTSRPVRLHDASTLRREVLPRSLETRLTEELTALWSARPLRRGTTAIYVVDADTGAPIYGVHEDDALNPASNVKLVSTATALDVLGLEFRYATRVFGPTPDAAGVVAGDIYVRGQADPLLRARHMTKLARDLAAAGVTRIEGRVIVGPGRLRDALGLSRYTLKVTGGDSRGDPARVEVSPPTTMIDVIADVTTSSRSRIHVDTSVIDDPVLGRRYRLEVSGTIRSKRTWRRRTRVSERALWTGHVLSAALERAGIAVTGGVAVESFERYVARVSARSLPFELARHESIPLRELVAMINKRSINYLADRVVMTAGAAAYGGPPTMAKAVRAMHAWLERKAGVPAERVVLDTGSGLSYKTELSVRQIVAVLRAAGGFKSHAPAAPAAPDADVSAPLAGFAREPGAVSGTTRDDDASAVARGDDAADDPGSDSEDDDDAHGDGDGDGDGDDDSDDADDDVRGDGAGPSAVERAFLASLAIAGVDGTLRGRFRRSPARAQVFGKTGTLSHVIALSGIVDDGPGNRLAFSIVTNGNRRKSRRSVRKQHEAIVEALQRYLHARAQRHR